MYNIYIWCNFCLTWETGLKTDEKKWMTWESRILESRPTTPVTFEPSIYIL